MSDDGKPETGKAKKRKTKASAKPPPAEPDTAKAEAAAADGPTAPVGFSARDTVGAATSEAAAKKGGGAGVAVFLAAAVAVVAVAGYLTRAAWLPGAGDKPAAVAGKPTDEPTEAMQPTAAGKTADVQGSAPTAGGAPATDADATAVAALAKEREQLRAEINRLIARLDGVEKSMDTAKKMIRATAPPEEKIAGVSSLEQLSERIGALEKNEATIKELKERVEKMEKDAAGGDGDVRAVVLAVAGLNDAVARGEPFERHLETLKVVAGGDPNIKAAAALLAKGAATGIPTLTQLRDRFDTMAGEIVHASKARDDSGWMARAANRISSLITWRRVGNGAKADSVEGVVARAESRLKNGDLAGAVKTLEGLASNKNAAAAAEPWLADAKTRVTAERAIASLHIHAVSLLSPAKQ